VAETLEEEAAKKAAPGTKEWLELPKNSDCWEIAKKVWPELSDNDPVLIRARYTNHVADIAWNGHHDFRLKKGEGAAIEGLLAEWRSRG
jgi:hypothetical protein